MPNIYFTTHGTAVGSDLPQVLLTGSASHRIAPKAMILSFSGSPADVQTLVVMERTTDAGTGGTALTESPTDPLSPTSSTAAVGGTFSGAPTDAAEVLRFAINQRSIKEVYWPDGEEPLSVAASANGLMVNSESSTGTPTMQIYLRWKE